jgi:ribonuclease E
VGKKVSVTVSRVLDGVAYATLADATPAPETITFEAEAEKPTRAPSAKKTVEKPTRAPSRKKAAEKPAAEPPPELEAEIAESKAEAVADEAAALAPEQPKKKRTRRGTRGGRGRKKTTSAAVVAEPTSEADGRKPVPRIHVPPADLAVEQEPAAPAEEPSAQAASDGQAKRKRTRRGTRGGRKRRKAPTNGDPAELTPEQDATEPTEYVPMSEWIEDFDPRSRAG